MSSRRNLLQIFDDRLAAERGTIYKQAPLRVALVYPSPYTVGMSSLGFQVMYRIMNNRPDTVCERAFLPDDVAEWKRSRVPLTTYESKQLVGNFDVIAFSLAYELELTGICECLELAGVPLLAADRGPRDPLVVIGGPLTFSNPIPAGPFADIILMGEAEEVIEAVLDAAAAGDPRSQLPELAERVGSYVPSIHGEVLRPVAKAGEAHLPAYSQILTPNTELSDMHLVENERGCSRACTFCVMRRSTNGGMRITATERVLATIPEYARKVGLVGAAVSDHPELPAILRGIIDGGRQVSLSSLRADRLTPEIVGLLKEGGYQTITVASDGASERLREMMVKRIREKHLRQVAELVRAHGLRQLKVYMMIGVPNETDEDIDELIRFSQELSRICSVAMGIAPFVAKRNTPLDAQGFVGIKPAEERLKRLRKGLAGRVDLRSTSARWAWVEYCLAQGGFRMGLAAMEAWRDGGSFHAWRRAIERAGGEPVGHAPAPVIPRSREERLALLR